MSVHFSLSNNIFSVKPRQILSCMKTFQTVAADIMGIDCRVSIVPTFPSPEEKVALVETVSIFSSPSAISTKHLTANCFPAGDWKKATRYNVRFTGITSEGSALDQPFGFAHFDKENSPLAIYFDVVGNRDGQEMIQAMTFHYPGSNIHEHKINDACIMAQL